MNEQEQRHEYWDHMSDLKSQIRDALKERGIESDPFLAEDDVIITNGSLAELMEFCQDWRSEIEELG